MKITRSNYQIWFADWLDNNLSDSQAKELKLFLAENPDLKEEFNELNEMRLQPAEIHMPGQAKLLRRSGDMEPGQFELLCAAAAEGDLDEAGLTEFRAMLEGNDEKQKTAEIFRRIRLVPERKSFPGKDMLLRRTTARKLISLALPLFAAAAVVVFVFLAVKPQETVLPLTSATLEIRYDNTHRISRSPVINNTGLENDPSRLSEPAYTTVTRQQQQEPEKTNSEPASPEHRQQFTATIAFLNEPTVEPAIVPGELVATKIAVPPTENEQFDYERSRLGRVLAFKFREKILNEELPEDKPLEAFEIAEAGVLGLNKLLGWDMALSRGTDENGEDQSVQFNSRLIKYTSPIKNEERAE